MKPIMDYIKEQEAKDYKVNLSSNLAAKSGFVKAAKKSAVTELGFIVIKEDKIRSYLQQLVKDDVRSSERFVEFDERSFVNDDKTRETLWCVGELKAPSMWFYNPERDRFRTDGFAWVEEKVEEYDGVPPSYVYEKLIKAKEAKVFDYFTVATIKRNIKLPDPLLLGRIKGDDNRYFIAQWDDDIHLDNLI